MKSVTEQTSNDQNNKKHNNDGRIYDDQNNNELADNDQNIKSQNTTEQSNKEDVGIKNNFLSNLIKWIIIIIALVVVFIWKKTDIIAAFEEMQSHPFWVTLLALLATILYFVIEGLIIRSMTIYEKRQMTWFESFKCSLFCAFYKLISVGSLSGIAEVYYISKHEIDPGRASGIVVVQYVYQKLGITILGLISFIGLYIMGVPTVVQYAKWGVLGSLIALVIVSALTILSTSRKLAEILVKLVDKLLGENGLFRKFIKDRDREKVQGLKEQIIEFNESGLYFWKHKILAVRVTLLEMLKMTCWYIIPAIVVIAVHKDANPFVSTMLMAMTNMVGTVMVAPAGAGTIEFVVGLLFGPLFGVTATTVAILYRFYTMVVPFIIGAFVFMFDSRAFKLAPAQKKDKA
ncbi:MAG: flippase-like domain-containing protein [Eubacterium sp.]|nr:flippase-like domain-containing protein [Eubacterium sp.]